MPEAGPFGWYSDWRNHGTAGPFDPPDVVDELEADLSVQDHLVAARMERAGDPHLALLGAGAPPLAAHAAARPARRPRGRLTQLGRGAWPGPW